MLIKRDDPLRLQFWSKKPTAKLALQYMGGVELKYMKQKCQIRKHHEDAHYALALFYYKKELAVKYST